MAEIEKICDRVTILRNGTDVDVVEVRNTPINEMINKMVGRELEDYYVHTPTVNKEVLLEVENFSGEGFETFTLN